MNKTQLKWYLESIEHEVSQINDQEFVGNIDFKLNIKHGGITNMNINLSKSVKMPDVVVRSGLSSIA